ncbi:MAG: hypothetical protein A2Y64_03530 [Candidatus Coatesbacteria bacterium RBG_13_66_14]|uniref:PsbP C-terminal domain-containing protein n=1 Tax=Candidatus Coatesbacteria bacterium RBG_13_66_14 TaxID=1817816 RepID=A0A1F5EVU4_9BACT|nr:MAG: hypothetical protein A2Y64_03530 [Candidatus Coatesbacteria bacterium RBG_13_66_14]
MLGLIPVACERAGEPVEDVVERTAVVFEPTNPWPLFNDTLGFVLYYDRDFWERAHATESPDGVGTVVMGSKEHREVLRVVVETMPDGVPLPARVAEQVEMLTAELPRFERLGEERVLIAGLEGRRLDYTFLEGETTMRVSEYHFYADDRYFVLGLGTEEPRWEAFEPRALAIAAGFRVTEPKTEPLEW